MSKLFTKINWGFLILLNIVIALAFANYTMPPKNLILITVDTLRYDLANANYISGLEKLRDTSVIFNNYYVSAPETGPSFSSLMTCKKVETHQVTGNGIELKEGPTLAEVLRSNGYHTYGIISLGVLQRRFGFNKGFDFYSDEFPDEWVKQGNEVLPQILAPINAASLKEPFFFWVHLADPHEAYRIKYQTKDVDLQRKLVQKDYINKVQLTSLYIDEIMKALNSSPYRSSTLTVFTADHGEGLGDHNWDGHVENLYDELIHVPLWVHYPWRKMQQRLKPNQVARNIDLMPTVLDLLHIKNDLSCDGSTLTVEKERVVYAETHRPDASKDKYAFISNNEKCIYTPEDNLTECYMLEADPKETTPMDKPFSLNGEVHLQKMINRKMVEQPTISQENKERLQALGYTK